MPSDALNSEIDALRSRLQAELDSQLSSLQSKLEERHQQELVEAKRLTAAEAQEYWSARIDSLRAEWASRLRAEVAGASAETARAQAAEIARLEAEKASFISAGKNSVRSAEGSGARLSDTAEASRAALNRLAGTLRTIGDASSLTAVLDALADGAAAEATQTALFVVSSSAASTGTANAPEMLEQWRSVGFDDRETDPVKMPAAGAVAHAVRMRQPTVTTKDADDVAGEPSRSGLVVPIVVGDKTVAVLYAEGEADVDASAAWPNAVQILCQHASVCLSQLTAFRIAQALGAGNNRPATSEEDDGSARRYARLLVSEIKLYNEAAVRTGRERRDLLERLRPEIDRARRLYEERVPVSIGHRAVLFQQELVHTLAEGDPDLLGASA
jgi:hypothetical protein